MTLLDTFIMSFGTEGLGEIAKEITDTEQKVNELEKKEKQLNKTIEEGKDDTAKARVELAKVKKELSETTDKLNKAKNSTGGFLLQLKNVAGVAAKVGGALIAVKKAVDFSSDFAEQALEMEEAAKKAGLTIEEFQKKNGRYTIFTKEDVNNAKLYEQTMRDIRMGTAAIGANLAQLFLPVMIQVAKVVRNVVDFFVDHGAFIKAAIIGIGVALTAVAIPAIINMGVALWGALAPVLPILLAVTAAIVAFSLIAEDIYKWIHGEPSLAELIFGDFKTFADNFMKGLQQIKEAFGVSFVEGIKTLCKNLFNFIIDSWNNIWNNIISKIPLIQKMTANKTPESSNTSKVATKTPDGSHASGLDYVPYDGYVAELHKGERVQTASEASDWRTNLMAAKKAVNFTANYPLNSIPSGAVSNAYNNTSNASNQNINISGITINTQATDSEGIANDLAGYIKQAFISLDDGMLA